jgi:hypothetical protein
LRKHLLSLQGINPDKEFSLERMIIRQEGAQSVFIYSPENVMGYRKLTLTIKTSGATANPSTMTDYSVNLITNVSIELGDDEIIVTSTYRSPSEQARVMYELLERDGEKGGVDYAKKLYGRSGDLVIDVYDELINGENQTPESIKNAMRDKILEVGPGSVSKHSSAPNKLNTIDISSGSINNNDLLEKIFRRLKDEGILRKYIPVPKDPAHHIEIIQPEEI